MTENVRSEHRPVNRQCARSVEKSGTVDLFGQQFALSPSGAMPYEAVDKLRETIRREVIPAYGTVKGLILGSLAILIPYAGRMQRRITHRMLIDGYFSMKHHDWITRPIPVSERTLMRHLADLEATGVISRQRDGNGQAYTYNFNFALLVAKRSVAAVYEAVTQYAQHIGRTISATRARIIAQKLVQSDALLDEIKATIYGLFGPQTPDNLSPHKDHPTPSTANASEGETRADDALNQQEDTSMGMLKQSRYERAQPAVEMPDRATRSAASILPQRRSHVSDSWADRPARIRRHVQEGEENRDTLQLGAELADESALSIDPAPAPRVRLSDFLSDAIGCVAERASNRRKATTTNPAKLEQVWAESILSATGTQATGWTIAERGQLRHIIKRVALPDPGITWSGFLSWIATRWGEANGLARPAAFRHDENVERIIKAQPRIYHVLRHAEEYMQVYAALFYGEGVPFRHKHEADELQAIYEQVGARMRLQSQVGVDHLPSALLSRSELDDKVTDAALRKEARALESRKRREEYRERLRAMRQKVGFTEEDPDKARKMLDSEIAAHRVREGWDDDALSQFVTATPGYYDEDEA